jgi:hypothetical protein
MNEWFDAMEGYGEGAEEFVLDALGPGDDSELGSKVASTISSFGAEFAESGVDDTDSEADAESVLMKLINNSRNGSTDSATLQVIRRSELPTGPIASEGSMFAMLKKNVGKVCGVNLSRWQAALMLPLGLVEDIVSCHIQRAPYTTSNDRRRP